MKSNKIKRDLFFILISSFIVIVLWIGFNVYNKSVASTIDETLAEQIEPITGSFDQEVIKHIKSRKKVIPIYQLTAQPTGTEEDADTPTPSPEPVEEESVILEDSGIPADSLDVPAETPIDEQQQSLNEGI